MGQRQHEGRRLKLRQLEILLAVADTGSMAKAAARLAISQPAISRAVADAEHALGVPLFERSTQGINPTQYGHAMLKRSIAAFDEIDQGIGGRVGMTVGQKLWNLSRMHQVFCVTHLPQLAAFDAADVDSSCPARFTTTQPTQALGMLNGEFLNAQAQIFARDDEAVVAPDEDVEALPRLGTDIAQQDAVGRLRPSSHAATARSCST